METFTTMEFIAASLAIWSFGVASFAIVIASIALIKQIGRENSTHTLIEKPIDPFSSSFDEGEDFADDIVRNAEKRLFESEDNYIGLRES